jgi:hypothetical protein
VAPGMRLMQFWRWQQRAKFGWHRRATATVALVAYLLTATGVPLPGRDLKRGSQPFPCQGHACGCSSAEQCWKRCCCYSPRQKLAWAQANGVTPPAALVAEVAQLDEREPHDHHDQIAIDEPRACCAHGHGNASATRQACDHHDCAAGDCDRQLSRRDHQPACCQQGNVARGVVIGILAQQCRGLSTMWCTCGSVLPPPAIGWQFRWDAVAWLTIDNPTACSAYLAPLLRPPRA